MLGPLKEVRTVTAQAVAQIFSGADAKSSLDAAAQQANLLIADYNAAQHRLTPGFDAAVRRRV